ncbi:hypothetical protein NDI76_04425 [Halogeometricum sp. S1BR25-6]|uniref:DUF7344 domain-containing protein n=1 Tax=Halogeometricum salsisoli TaxID=2950536 RepID=A0ABU2GCG0_9EURY|nr:hypothetical protein [Halogeometricum sp. S1BR25-6]MDS0297979.1 hypothetical protein [Halogeometricum sp. S1BR25-6]
MEERFAGTGTGTLARSRRLVALVALREHGGAMTPAELASAVASRESGRPSAAVADDHVERVLSSLRRWHLPALSNAGLVRVIADSDSESDAGERVALDADSADVRRIVAALFESDVEDGAATGE